MKNVVVALLSCLAATSVAFEINDTNFEDVVLKSNKTTFVKFYASWCGHCKKMAPAWEALEHSYASRDNLQFVEIDGDKFNKYSKKYNIQGFPTLKLFKSEDVSDPIDYSGARDVDSMVNFVSESTGIQPDKLLKASRVVNLDDGSFERLVTKKGKSAFIFFTSEKDADRKEWAASWDQLAEAFHPELEKVIIGKVLKEGDEPVDWLRSVLNVTSFPSIVYVNKGDVETAEKFDGSSDVDGLIAFLNEKLLTKRTLRGELKATAGTIPQMDKYLIEYVKVNAKERRAMVSKVIDQLKKVDDSIFKEEIKYYAKIISVLLSSDGTDFLGTEKERLNKLKDDKALDNAALDGIQMKINMLQFCQDAAAGIAKPRVVPEEPEEPEEEKSEESKPEESKETEEKKAEESESETTASTLSKDEL
ncbi:DEKNAAC104339 [Brettanomyces naardenensis]|uniref:protein disulfide-isomerase n=1 Tax=Brettanomyces naardenensis TaxID=13370 RepID=A0A448YQI5_BRENA|nr:DEKNAAC104339 [Brettanomyces naardenensis]